MYRIMIVEDDSIICEEITAHLTRWGYEVTSAKDFENITTEFVAVQPHLVLMDISLPFYNGYYWCSEIRRISKIPIMFVSSSSDDINIVMAMNMGGDDFILKPFSPDVLSAKIQAMLRRSYDFQPQSTLLEHKGIILNLSDTTLSAGKKKVELTKNEFKTLQLLFENKGRVVPREEIMKRLWDSDCFIDDNTLTVNITRLRRKLEDIGTLDFISTRKGIGYLLED